MTIRDTLSVLAILKAAYPHSFKDMSSADYDATINLWQRIFTNDDAGTVTAAVEALIASRTVGYSPTIGEVREQMMKLVGSDELSENAAWALVSKACRNGIYGSEKEFAKLPPMVQKAIGGHEMLKEWGMMDAATVESVVSSNFMRTYRAAMAREKEQAKLPESVRQTILGTSNNFLLGG